MSVIGLEIASRAAGALSAAAAAATLPENRQAPETRHAPENGQSPVADRMARIAAIERAGLLIGKAKLAGAMGQSDRTMRAYTSAELRMPDAILIDAAGALEREAKAILDHAAKLRAMAGANSGGGQCE